MPKAPGRSLERQHAGARLSWRASALTWLWLSLSVIGLDRYTKHLAESSLLPYEPVPITSFFNLTLMFNTGAAFSFLRDAGGWQRWVFTGIALVVSAVVVVLLRRLPRYQGWSGAGLALVLGGALGNVWDRLRLGHVVDFLDVHYLGWHWPAFNVADSAITVGVACLLIGAVRGEQAW